jgi:hypothetical protein
VAIDLTVQKLPDNLSAGVRNAEDRRSLRVWAESTFHAAPGLQIKRNVIDPTGGAQYTGGSSWVPGMPLVSSNSGLSESCVIVPLTADQRYLETLHGLEGGYEVRPVQAAGMPRAQKRAPGPAPRRKVRYPKHHKTVLAAELCDCPQHTQARNLAYLRAQRNAGSPR